MTRRSSGQTAVFTVPEVAEMLRCSPKTVYEMVRRREIPGVRRVGRSLRIARGPLLRWLGQDPASEGND